MTDFNLPPGCSTSDIPGCRPEDERKEIVMDDAYGELDSLLDEWEQSYEGEICSWDAKTIVDWWREGHPDIIGYEWAPGVLEYGHECVVRQRVRQKAINEGRDPEYAILQREYFQARVRGDSKALDA